MTTIPPLPPGVIPDRKRDDAPLVTTEGLRRGDVVQIAVQLTDKQNGQPFWWKRFAAVAHVHNRRRFDALTLKMRPNLSDDFDGDIRAIDLTERMEQQVVTKLPSHMWPPGVVAMHMKAITLGWIKIEGRSNDTFREAPRSQARRGSAGNR